MKKYIILLLAFMGAFIGANACPTCEANQPKLFKGITHGALPESKWDYVIVAFTALVVVVSLFYAIKWLVKPGEKNELHIKRTILKFDQNGYGN